LIEEGLVYKVSEADVAIANKRMTSIPHDFRLIFKMKTKLIKLDQSPDSSKKR